MGFLGGGGSGGGFAKPKPKPRPAAAPPAPQTFETVAEPVTPIVQAAAQAAALAVSQVRSKKRRRSIFSRAEEAASNDVVIPALQPGLKNLGD